MQAKSRCSQCKQGYTRPLGKWPALDLEKRCNECVYRDRPAEDRDYGFKEFMRTFELDNKTTHRLHCQDCATAYKDVPKQRWEDYDEWRCEPCEKKWLASFTTCCSHCSQSLQLKEYNQCIACDYALCHQCAESGEIMHQHNAFRNDVYMGQTTPTLMMSYLSGRRVREDDKERASGPCRKCGLNTRSRCKRCKVFYCGQACQREDWERHRVYCVPLIDEKEKK